VDMEVSSGDESDVEMRPSQDLQSKYEEKKRIEEKIQALMKDFERKRLEEKARKASEAAAASLESTLTNVVSTTSELPTAAGREYAAVQAFYTGPNKGFGVQAVAPIKKYGRDPSHTHHYMFEIGSMIIDATKKGNCSRFMNHSCEPNAVCEK
ncbi:hypothetical protein TELCIR_21306, partial [Teladorsagia circumcincta]